MVPTHAFQSYASIISQQNIREVFLVEDIVEGNFFFRQQKVFCLLLHRIWQVGAQILASAKEIQVPQDQPAYCMELQDAWHARLH